MYFITCNVRVFNATACLTFGVANASIIPDSSFTASSHYDNKDYLPQFARFSSENIGWAPKHSNNAFLQIDLGIVRSICAIATKGDNRYHEWVTLYKLQLSLDGTTWNYYQENNIDKVKLLNKNCETILIY